MKQYKIKSFITILNVFLLLMLMLIGYQIVKKVLGANMGAVTSEPVAAKENTPIGKTSLSSNLSISNYNAVWERDLFNISQKVLLPPKKQVDFANVAEADKNIGLKLVGTFGGYIFDQSLRPVIRFAIIENNIGHNIYYEGDTADNYVIKKILRNNVIIATEDGNKYLALKSDHADRGETVLASSSQPPPGVSMHNRVGGRYKTVELPREEIMAAFDDIERGLMKTGINSYKLGKLTGFDIGSLSDKSTLKKIGLRSHDKILTVNDKSINGESGVFEFFEQIAEGKKVTIKYRRRNRTRRIELNPI